MADFLFIHFDRFENSGNMKPGDRWTIVVKTLRRDRFFDPWEPGSTYQIVQFILKDDDKLHPLNEVQKAVIDEWNHIYKHIPNNPSLFTS